MLKPVAPTPRPNIHATHSNVFGYTVYWMLPEGVVTKDDWDDRMRVAMESVDSASLRDILTHLTVSPETTAQATLSTHHTSSDCLIVFKTSTSEATIIHECLHAVFHIGRHIGLNPCKETEEWCCYILMHLVSEVKTSLA